MRSEDFPIFFAVLRFKLGGDDNRRFRCAWNSGRVWTNEQLEVYGITVDPAGNVFTGNGKISLVGTNWVVNTIPIGSSRGYETGGAFAATGINSVCYSSNGIIGTLALVGTNWITTVLAGAYDESGNVDGTGDAVRFGNIFGLAADASGTIYAVDSENNVIRKGVFRQYGQANTVAYSPGVMNACLSVTMTPLQADGPWHFPWEPGWHNSGDTVSNLVAGNYTVTFRNLPGWLAYPPTLTVVLTNNSSTVITNQYYPTEGADTNEGAGTLVVNLGANPPPGAGWGFIGDNNPTLPSGLSTNLTAGTYLIEFAAVNGRVKPGSLSVPVMAGQPTYVNVSYLLAGTPPANVYLPFLVATNNLTNVAQYPFGYCGQLQSDVGYGSGAAVSTNVVLTVAHLVFDDQTLSYVSQVYWFIQEEAGISEPPPQAARGVGMYLADMQRSGQMI